MAGRENPETKLTKYVRLALERAGAYSVKISDTFTRGIPDMMVVGNRIVMVELKVDRVFATKATWKQLGLSGPQHQRIIEICRRAGSAACVVTGRGGDPGSIRVWSPDDPTNNASDGYHVAVPSGIEEVVSWLIR